MCLWPHYSKANYQNVLKSVGSEIKMSLICKFSGHKYKVDPYKRVRYSRSGAIITRYYRCQRCGKLEKVMLY